MPNNANTMPPVASITALIVAAGRGSRIAADTGSLPKQYLTVGSRAILAHTINAIAGNPGIDRIVTVIHKDDRENYDAAITQCVSTDKLCAPVFGGATRQESVRLGLEAIVDVAPTHVLIHDAARPFVDSATIDRVISALGDGECAALAASATIDTLKRVDDDGHVVDTVARDGLWVAQTPQGFEFDAILKAHRDAFASGSNSFTDDAAVAEWAGLRVRIVEGNRDNIKITTRSDLLAADNKLKSQDWSRLADVRVGSGYDVHAFTDGDHVILGGVRIAHDKRLSGHSDADVALHAITDAIFGALSDGDIGSHFPPSDPQWKGVTSLIFLEHAVSLVDARLGKIAHLDLTIICEEPKIGPHRDAMRARIAEICRLDIGRVAVKATTSERLGFTGRGEGIAAMATATVRLPLD